MLLIFEPDGQYSVAGVGTCHLMMKSMAHSFKEESKLMYSSWATNVNVHQNFSDNLRMHLGMTYTSKWILFCYLNSYSQVW